MQNYSRRIKVCQLFLIYTSNVKMGYSSIIWWSAAALQHPHKHLWGIHPKEFHWGHHFGFVFSFVLQEWSLYVKLIVSAFRPSTWTFLVPNMYIERIYHSLELAGNTRTFREENYLINQICPARLNKLEFSHSKWPAGRPVLANGKCP